MSFHAHRSRTVHSLVLALATGLLLAGSTAPRPALAEQTAFRIDQLLLRDPHMFTEVIVCLDITNLVNQEVNAALAGDSDGDGLLDLSPLLVFDPLDQGGPGGTLFVHFGDCTVPAGSTTCTQDPLSPFEPVAYLNGGGTCLGTVPGTVRPYSPPVTVPAAPCFTTEPYDALLNLLGLEFVLEATQIAATYVGEPAGELTDGLLRGFLDQASADLIVFPPDVPVVGGQSLGSLLRGGAGNCASGSDRDLGPDGQTPGWWMYFNFTAVEVPFTGATGIAEASVPTAAAVRLAPAVPNPFNPATTLSFSLPDAAPVRLSIIDPAGRLVRTLLDGVQASGRHTIVWDGRDQEGRGVASGIYFARLAGDGGTTSQKLVLSK